MRSCTIWCCATTLPWLVRDRARSHMMSKARWHWASPRMAWWMRPPASRFCASTLAPFSGPSRWSAGTCTSV